MCCGACSWVVVKRRSNDPAAASRTDATFANPMYELDADLEGTCGEMAPLPSDGGAGRTSSSTLHLKVDDDLYGGFGGPEKETMYLDVAPASLD